VTFNVVVSLSFVVIDWLTADGRLKKGWDRGVVRWHYYFKSRVRWVLRKRVMGLPLWTLICTILCFLVHCMLASSPSVSKSSGGVSWPWCQHSTEPLKQTSSIVVVVKCSIEQIREERRSWMWQHGVVTYISGRCTWWSWQRRL